MAAEPVLTVTDRGRRVPLDAARLRALIESACAGLGDEVRAEPILAETRRNLYDGVPIDEVHKAAILAARTLIEKDPGYTRATSRLLLHTIRREILGEELLHADMKARYPEYFPQFVKRGVDAELLDERLLQFDLASASARRSTPTATCSSTTSACRRSTTATSCTSTKRASRCRRRSSCASRWAWR